MPTLVTLVDGTVPVAADFNGNFNALNRIAGLNTQITGYSTGDLLYASASDTLSRRSIGASGSVLTVSGGIPVWGAAGSSLPRSYLAGFGLSNNATDATNDIDIAIGECRDETDSEDLALTTALTKRLDAVWAEGTNAGGLDTGTKAVSTWYHLWLIKRPDTGVVDALFSLSATAPTMPSSYSRRRLLGSVLTDSGGALYAFGQDGDRFWWKTRALEVDQTGVGAARQTYTVRTPRGRTLWALLQVSGIVTDYPLDATVADDAASDTVAPLSTVRAQGAAFTMGKLTVRTNTSSQIVVRPQNNDTIKIVTEGWIDRRGRDA